jgi:hypothetical protein
MDDGGDLGTTRVLIYAIAILGGLLVGFLIKRWEHAAHFERVPHNRLSRHHRTPWPVDNPRAAQDASAALP